MSLLDLPSALIPVVETFERLGVPYAVGGSIASSSHGIMRATIDVDLVVPLRHEDVNGLVSLLKDDYYIDASMIEEAISRSASFNLIHLESMTKIDVFILKSRPYDQHAFQRRQKIRISKAAGTPEVNIYSPEDTILNKLEWYQEGGEISERQWNDILGVLKVQSTSLDFTYLRQWAKEIKVSDSLEKAFQDAGLSKVPW